MVINNNNMLVLASNNQGKVIEFSALLKPLGITVVPQSQWNVPECPEPHGTFVENALAKARHACQYTGMPSIADDSGLCVLALNNQPGVLSARFSIQDNHFNNNSVNKQTIHTLNNDLVLQRLKILEDKQEGKEEKTNRSAYFVCVLVALKHVLDPEPLIAIGRWHGLINNKIEGVEGFGYDPIFYCKHYERSAGLLSADEKNAVSHRGQATRQMIELLKHVWGIK